MRKVLRTGTKSKTSLCADEASAVGANFRFHFFDSTGDDFAIVRAVLFEPFSDFDLVGNLVKFTKLRFG